MTIRHGVPAINVKVYRGLEDVKEATYIDARAEVEHGELFTRAYVLGLPTHVWEHAWESACESQLELAEQDAKMLFGQHVSVYLDGRSGGWLCVRGLSEGVDRDWTSTDYARDRLPSLVGAVSPEVLAQAGTLGGRWEYFERCAKAYSAEVPEQAIYMLALNQFSVDGPRMARELETGKRVYRLIGLVDIEATTLEEAYRELRRGMDAAGFALGWESSDEWYGPDGERGDVRELAKVASDNNGGGA